MEEYLSKDGCMEVRTQLESICHREIEAMLLEQNAVRKQTHLTTTGSNTESGRVILSERRSHRPHRIHFLSSKHHPGGRNSRPFLPNRILLSSLTRSNASRVFISASPPFTAVSPTPPSSLSPNASYSNGLHRTRPLLQKISTTLSKKPCRFPPRSPSPPARWASPTSPFPTSLLFRRRSRDCVSSLSSQTPPNSRFPSSRTSFTSCRALSNANASLAVILTASSRSHRSSSLPSRRRFGRWRARQTTRGWW